MDFVANESNCKIETRIVFQNGAPSVHGKIFPFSGSERCIEFSVAQNMDIRSETGRVVMYPFIHVNFQNSFICDYEVSQVMKAMDIARVRMDRCHALFNQFTQFDQFLAALDSVLSFPVTEKGSRFLEHYEEASLYLMLCSFRTDNAIDQTLQALSQVRPQFFSYQFPPVFHQAMTEFVSFHSEFEEGFDIHGFIEKKSGQLFF